MFKLIKTFFSWIHRLIHPKSGQVSSSDPNEMERSGGDSENVTELANQDSQPSLSDSISSNDNENEEQESVSADTGGSEDDDSGNNEDSIEDDEQRSSSGNDKQEDASTETEADPDTSTFSGIDQTDGKKAIDSADTGEGEGNDSSNNDESIEGGEQRSSSGNDKQEGAATETETDPDTSTSSGIDQTDDAKAIDSADTGGSEGDDSGSDEDSIEDEEQDAPLGHDKQEYTPTQTETADPDETRSIGSDSAANNGPDTIADSTAGEKRKTRAKPPAEIGGRRDQSDRAAKAGNNSKDTSTFTPRPELICRRSSESLQWEIVLSVPQECRIGKVQHNDTPLFSENGEYRLPRFSGNLLVAYSDNAKKERIPLFDNGAPLIFKLRHDWEGDGRKVHGITQGHFIVIAPSHWNRTGHVPVEFERCEDAEYLAHYFYKDKGNTTDDLGSFDKCSVTLTRTRFTLSGTRVFDDSEEGELFVGDPPELELKRDIVWARLGEEKKNGWGKNFDPATRLGDVMNGRQGRFFLRVYDNETMVDSAEFRYYATLHEIRINGEPYVCDMLLPPSSDGHASSTLQFTTADGAIIPPILQKNYPYVTLGEDDIVTVAPDPNGDEIICSLGTETSSVDILIKLPHIWWRIKQIDGDAGAWRDTALVMTRGEFREIAYADGVMELRLPSHIQRMNAGFGDNLDQKFPVGDGIPLRAFVDYEEIDSPLVEDTPFHTQCGGKTVSLIRVCADPPPVQPDVLPEGRLFVLVKRKSGGWRRGKGFSYVELRNAGMTTADALRLSIRVDMRRHSAHQANTETLLRVKNYA